MIFFLILGFVSNSNGLFSSYATSRDTKMETYLKAIEPLYVDSWQKAAHQLATPLLCFGIPCVYFLATMAGYACMRYVNFYTVGAKVMALKGGKKLSSGKIIKAYDNGTCEVVFGSKDVETLSKVEVHPSGFAPPDWFKSVYNLAQVKAPEAPRGTRCH